jgi:hypothetical protein
MSAKTLGERENPRDMVENRKGRGGDENCHIPVGVMGAGRELGVGTRKIRGGWGFPQIYFWRGRECVRMGLVWRGAITICIGRDSGGGGERLAGDQGAAEEAADGEEGKGGQHDQSEKEAAGCVGARAGGMRRAVAGFVRSGGLVGN